MQKYLLYKLLKFEAKTSMFGGVIEISLGDYFFLGHPVYTHIQGCLPFR